LSVTRSTGRMGPNIDIQTTGSVMQETTHTELNSPKADISSRPSSNRVSGKENPPIQECSVAEVKSARSLHSSSGISAHVRKAATQRRKRDATGAAGKPAAGTGSTVRPRSPFIVEFPSVVEGAPYNWYNFPRGALMSILLFISGVRHVQEANQSCPICSLLGLQFSGKTSCRL
jgi:hypothetical protein